MWDVSANDRGDPLSDWMAGFGFVLLNKRRVPTIFHPRGTSVVDTSWANGGALRLVRSWGVVMDAEVFSDHRSIVIGLTGNACAVQRRELVTLRLPKWSLTRLDAKIILKRERPLGPLYQRVCERKNF